MAHRNSKTYKIILSGGGTGGHIYPAIAIANELKKRFPEADFLFVGAKNRMEMEKVPQAGYDIKGLWISGIQRKLTLKNLAFPFKLISSLYHAYRIVLKYKPDIAIGTGGFASGPLLQVANLRGVPTLVQEQNSYPGITNKLLSKRADKICVAYSGLERFFPKEKMIKTGNPVRQDLLDISDKLSASQSFFSLKKNKKTLLVLGGSLGAKAINELVENHIDYFRNNNIQVIWQCGTLYKSRFESYNDLEDVQVHSFLNRMDLAYAGADVIISRAGASSVSELCIVGKPVIFIPSPYVAEDHQTKNAQAIVEESSAILIAQKDLETQFKTKFSELLASEELQRALSTNIKKLALINATKDIVDQVEQLLNK